MERREGREIALLATGKDNPRNSEGSFIKLKDGRIAFAFSRYVGDSWQDHQPCKIACVYSYDNGESFDTQNIEILVDPKEYGQTNVMSVTLRYMQNGDIGLFFLLKVTDLGCATKYILRRYKDDFSNFLEETVVLPDKYTGYFVVNNDRVVKLSSGRWIVMASLHQSYQGYMDENASDSLNMRGIACTFISDDDGRTWRQSKHIMTLNESSATSGLQEPGCVELGGGVIYAYFRTSLGRQYESVSIDGGETWFTPQPSRFSSPESPMLIKKNESTGKYYALWNPTPNYTGRPRTVGYWNGGRVPLVIAESDDGVKFSEPKVLEDDETRGFCYPAMEFLEDGILLAYCSGGKEEDGCLNRITIKKIGL